VEERLVVTYANSGSSQRKVNAQVAGAIDRGWRDMRDRRPRDAGDGVAGLGDAAK
jgi:hypothetical protein